MISRFEQNEAFLQYLEDPNAYSRAKQINDYIKVLASGGSTRAFVPLLTTKEYDHFLQYRMGLAPAAALAMAVRDSEAQ